jgi:hypothetical protein
MHALTHKIFPSNSEGFKPFFVNLVDMDIVERKTKKYYFKEPNLSRLRELGSLVTSPEDFRKNHGNFI